MSVIISSSTCFQFASTTSRRYCDSGDTRFFFLSRITCSRLSCSRRSSVICWRSSHLSKYNPRRHHHIGVNAAGVTGVSTPQYLTCSGSWMYWTPQQLLVSYNIACTMHYFRQRIDCVVGAVVEQIYSRAVTCNRDNTRHQYRLPWNALRLPQNAPKCVWWPGCPDPLGELTALPQTPQLD